MFAPSGKGTGESVSSLWTSMLGLIKMQAGLDVARLDGLPAAFLTSRIVMMLPVCGPHFRKRKYRAYGGFLAMRVKRH